MINTLAASRLYARDAIVVDMGTATTFDCITADGVFLGGVIAPGVATSAETLTRRTSKLPATELIVPKRVIGTPHGGVHSRRGDVRRRRRDRRHRAADQAGVAATASGRWSIATGGFAETMAPLCTEFDRVEPYLTLQGLADGARGCFGGARTLYRRNAVSQIVA